MTPLRLLAGLAILGIASAAPLSGQTTHTVTLTGDRASARYRFDPERVTVRPGDIVRFVVASGAPHTITFDSTGMTAADQAALDRALARRVSFLSGPMLTRDGEAYQLVVPSLTAGTYRYYCLPHRAYRSGGALVVAR